MILSLVLVAPLLSAIDTSRRHHIALKCATEKVHVRLFDQDGKFIEKFDKSLDLKDPKADLITRNDNQSVEAPKRYVATSASEGCIQGRAERERDTDAPINKFDMPCSSDLAVDIIITSDPPATFVVTREIQSTAGVICRSIDLLHNGSPIRYYTPDEKLIVDAKAIDYQNMTCHIEFVWSDVPRTTKTIQNSSCSAGWKSFTITRKPL